MKTTKIGRIALLLVSVFALLGLSACVEEPPAPAPDPDPEPSGPTLTTDIPVTNLDPNGTTTVTVTGTGFDTAGGVGTRPPLMGHVTGVYLVFGAVADDWRPSEGAPGTARQTIQQWWPLPEPSYTLAMDTFGGLADEVVLMNADGSFTAEFEITKADGVTNPNFGIYTYGAGGVTKADQEIFIPVTFAAG